MALSTRNAAAKKSKYVPYERQNGIVDKSVEKLDQPQTKPFGKCNFSPHHLHAASSLILLSHPVPDYRVLIPFHL